MLVVLKIGGSLCRDPKILKKLLKKISALSCKFDFLVVPGGGGFADLVRSYDKKFELKPEISHEMAILAMDINGQLICNFNGFYPAYDLNFKRNKKIPVLIPSRFLSNKKIRKTWDVTSDSIAAYVAGLINADMLILLKDVDGVFSGDPKKNRDVIMFERINAKNLKKIKSSCLDKEFPDFIKKFKLKSYVINGKTPERLEDLLNGKRFVGTTIEE